MPAIVVDTGVLLVAERLHAEASPECVNSCAKLLVKIRNGTGGACIVLDEAGQILAEYTGSRLTSRDPRGAGALFLVWLLTNRSNPAACETVALDLDEGGTDYTAFPTDVALARFDRSDRKFVAVSIAHPQRPAISVALDRGWTNFQAALNAKNVTIDFRCPADSARIAARRSPPRIRKRRD